MINYKFQDSQDNQPHPTTSPPPDSEGSTYIDLDNQSCLQQVSANEPSSVATSFPSNNTVNNAMYHNQVMSNTYMNQNQMCYGYQNSQMNNYFNSPIMPFQPQTYNWNQNQYYNTPEVNRWPQDQDRYSSNYRFAHETPCSTPVSNNSSYDKVQYKVQNLYWNLHKNYLIKRNDSLVHLFIKIIFIIMNLCILQKIHIFICLHFL